jgi:hypothetical protein
MTVAAAAGRAHGDEYGIRSCHGGRQIGCEFQPTAADVARNKIG